MLFRTKEPLDLKWEEIPFYSKRWFLALLLLFFIPALIFVGLKGEVYALHEYKVYKLVSGKMLLILGLLSASGTLLLLFLSFYFDRAIGVSTFSLSGILLQCFNAFFLQWVN